MSKATIEDDVIELSKEMGVDIKNYSPLLNPIIFAETYMKNYLKEGLRKFQKKIISCKDKNVVLRIGRRSGKTVVLSVKAIYEAITNENFRVVIVTPAQRQYELIYDTIMNKMLMQHPDLMKCVERSIKTPGKIWFTSGSTISFFTAGTKSGQGAENVRGQGADLLILDEADYLSAKDIEAILALKYEHPNVVTWASSTPTGKRSYFYQWCTDKRKGWTEFWYPSAKANPNWTPEMEADARREYPDEAYKKEFGAEFGMENAGVFNKLFVEHAFNTGEGRYNYSPLYMPMYGYMQRPEYMAIRTFGVDWDKVGAPTNIVILEQITPELYWVVNRVQIPQSEFTLTHAVNTIIDLNELWRPQWIYIDKGFGEMQTEVLKLYGKSHKETLLDKIVKPIAFGGKVDVISAVDGVKDRKEAKHFMVNMMQKSLEDKRIIMNPNDEVMKMEYINYQIIGFGTNGKPIYQDGDDHAIAATGLAHLAMVQNYDELFIMHNQAIYSHMPTVIKPTKKVYTQKYLSYKDFATDNVNPNYRAKSFNYSRGMSNGAIRRSNAGRTLQRSFRNGL